MNSLCVICGKSEGELCAVSRGVERILYYSSVLQDEVGSRIKECTVVRVHEDCRKHYTRRPPNIKKGNGEPLPTAIKRSDSLDFKSQCLFCGKQALKDPKHPCSSNITQVCTLQVLDKIRQQANERLDEWGDIVKLRLTGVIDLVAAEGRYHRSCYQHFLRPNSSLPGVKQRSVGRPESKQSLDAFKKLCSYIEDNDECQFSIPDLVRLMKEFDPSLEIYSEKHLKRKLKEYYGNSLTITEVIGSCNVLCFSGNRDAILTEEWYKYKHISDTDERRRIVEMAAKIIREDIRSRAYECNVYPSTADILTGGSNLIPESLSVLMDEVIIPKSKTADQSRYKRKSVALQHSVVAAARPRSFISPILHGLSVHLHRKFGSRLLIDVLANLGFCHNYKETMRFESSVTLSDNMLVNNASYIQFIFDNADHNIRSLDGNDTFHVMGGLMCVTPASSLPPEKAFLRDCPGISSSLENEGNIQIAWYKQPDKSGLSLIVAQNLNLNIEPESAVKARTTDLLWALVFLSQSNVPQIPSWSGFMEASHKYINNSSEKSALVPLPFINHSPTNPSTIYTALLYAAKEASRIQQSKVFVTFDQPLCHKAYDILTAASEASELSRVEVRLGGFHLLMSYLGAIGMIMGGSGLDELWNNIYAHNSVTHMMNGRQYARALRAHFLTQQALIHILFTMCSERQDVIDSLEYTFSDILSGELLLEDAIESRDVLAATTSVNKKIIELASKSRTAKLWLQYIELIEIVRLYIRAERSGDWNLHLFCVQQMLPYFHATGHFNYAKTAHIYLQRMLLVRETMSPSEIDKFVGKSYFTIRRSDKFWSGTWSDMVIEQYLMRSMKTIGGLTHGRGFKSSTLAKWIKTMPATTKIVDAIETFSGVTSHTTEQHVELREARIKRDLIDTKKILEWLTLHNPFQTDTELLVCISNGIIAETTVNCDQAKEVGMESMSKVTGKSFNDIHLSRKSIVTTLATARKGIRIGKEVVEVDSNQLFHRMVCTVRSDEELEEIFKFELAAWPPSLFKDCLMRKGSGKSTLIPLLETYCLPSNSLPNDVMNPIYTIDGGYLLHKCVWQRSQKYKEIADMFVSYVRNHYGTENVTVVFDGYSKPSTKDSERERRGSSVEVAVEENALAVLPPSEFLNNRTNKTGLISLLTKYFLLAGIQVLQAETDADLMIVTNAINVSKCGKSSVMVGEDTDLLVLLAGLSDFNTNTYMLIPNKGNRQNKIFSSKLLQESLAEMKDLLLISHAFTGCDTTSAIHGKGKIQAFNKLKKDKCLQTEMAIFNKVNATQEEISKAGESMMSVLYGGKSSDSLDQLRYKLYCTTVAKQKVENSFKLESLPPTSDAARLHSFRVYLQVQQWKSEALDPLNWGWKIYNGQLLPIPASKLPAPQQLLNLVSCNCKKGCDKRSCECQRNGLNCSSMCGHCSGHGCSNREPLQDEELDQFDELLVNY